MPTLFCHTLPADSSYVPFSVVHLLVSTYVRIKLQPFTATCFSLFKYLIIYLGPFLSLCINLTHSFKDSKFFIIWMWHILLNPVVDIWVASSFQNRTEKFPSPGLYGKMKVKCTIKGSSQFRVKCAGPWASNTVGLWEGHGGLPHPVRTDQISKHLYPWRSKGRSPELRYIFVRSTVICQWHFKLPGLFWTSCLWPISTFSCCSVQVVAETSSHTPNCTRTSKLSGFQISSFCFEITISLHVLLL